MDIKKLKHKLMVERIKGDFPNYTTLINCGEDFYVVLGLWGGLPFIREHIIKVIYNGEDVTEEYISLFLQGMSKDFGGTIYNNTCDEIRERHGH